MVNIFGFNQKLYIMFHNSVFYKILYQYRNIKMVQNSKKCKTMPNNINVTALHFTVTSVLLFEIKINKIQIKQISTFAYNAHIVH